MGSASLTRTRKSKIYAPRLASLRSERMLGSNAGHENVKFKEKMKKEIEQEDLSHPLTLPL